MTCLIWRTKFCAVNILWRVLHGRWAHFPRLWWSFIILIPLPLSSSSLSASAVGDVVTFQRFKQLSLTRERNLMRVAECAHSEARNPSFVDFQSKVLRTVSEGPGETTPIKCHYQSKEQTKGEVHVTCIRLSWSLPSNNGSSNRIRPNRTGSDKSRAPITRIIDFGFSLQVQTASLTTETWINQRIKNFFSIVFLLRSGIHNEGFTFMFSLEMISEFHLIFANKKDWQQRDVTIIVEFANDFFWYKSPREI